MPKKRNLKTKNDEYVKHVDCTTIGHEERCINKDIVQLKEPRVNQSEGKLMGDQMWKGHTLSVNPM